MRKLFIFLLFISAMCQVGYSSDFYSIDSLGIAEKGGDSFIIHQVEAGETLYALSRMYKVSVQEIKDANDGSMSSLDIGQKVLVPSIQRQTDKNTTVHIVKSSETLFSISRNYNVQVDELKAWNHLNGNSISVGQELIIKNEGTGTTESTPATAVASNRKSHEVQESQTLYSISRMYGVSTSQLRAWNNLSSDNLNIGQVLVVSDEAVNDSAAQSNSSMLPQSENQGAVSQPAEEASVPETQVTTEELSTTVAPAVTMAPTINEETDRIETPAEKVIQHGMAEVIEDTQDTKKYLALHKNAPVGTIMQVKNEMNDQTVFVRVVGAIPPTGDNEKLLLKISKKAFDRLGAVDSRFPVEVSYIP